jgi:(2Fe-2S) ferredoxin
MPEPERQRKRSCDAASQDSGDDAPVASALPNQPPARLNQATKAAHSPCGDEASPPRASITICMGSSCFSRGNSRNIEVVQDFLKTQSLPPSVELNGHLCEGHCKSGPNVTINGKMYHEVDPIVIVGLLNHFVPKAKP